MEFFNVVDNLYILFAFIQKEYLWEHNNTYSICFSVLGICKHTSALLFALLQAVEQGKNRSCTSTAQAWGKRKKSHEPDFITNIKIKKSTKDCTTDLRPERIPRNTYDPRPVELRQSSKLENFDLFKLNIVTNGGASILHCVDDSKKVNPNAILVEPESDLNVVCTETVTSCNIPSTVLELSAACKITNSRVYCTLSNG